MYRCRCCLYRTGGVLSRGVLSRGVGADSQIFHLAIPAPARVGIPTGGRVPTHPSRARASVSFISRVSRCHSARRFVAFVCNDVLWAVDLRVIVARTPLWHLCLCVCGVLVPGLGSVGRDSHLVKRASYSSTRTTSRDMRRNELALRVRTPGFWPLPERRLFTPTFSHRTKHI